MNQGYYQAPTIFKNSIVFVSEDDLWTVPVAGGVARKISSTNGKISFPKYSPDGQLIAFTGTEEGASEVFVMPAEGGEIQRLTYLSHIAQVTGWISNDEVLFNSAGRHAVRTPELLKVSIEAHSPEPLKLGPATSMTLNHSGWSVIERNAHRPDPAHWKRYRGGTAGQLWTANSWDGEYTRILEKVDGNFAFPQWIEDRLFFISDHDGWGNVYSCELDGSQLKQHTHSKDFYARNLNGDGKNLVFQMGADIYFLDPTSNETKKIEIQFHSQSPQKQRKFVKATKYWEHLDVNFADQKIAFGSRGQVFSFSPWKGAVFKNGNKDFTRSRLGTWLNDNQRLALVNELSGKSKIEVYLSGKNEPELEIDFPFGKILKMKANPKKDVLAVANNRNELHVVDLKSKEVVKVCQNKFGFFYNDGINWSPDGEWLAYCQNIDGENKQVHVYNLSTQVIKSVTREGLSFRTPVFDSEGKYLFFAGAERLNPVYSDVGFSLGFPKSDLPCFVTLTTNTTSPFQKIAKKSDEEKHDDKKTENKNEDIKVEIDFDGIFDRMMCLPVKEKRQLKIVGYSKDKLYYTSEYPKGALQRNIFSDEPNAETNVQVYDFNLKKEEDYVSSVTDFGISPDGNWQFLRVKNDFQISKITAKPDLKKPKEFNEKSGWVDFSKVRVLIEPLKEWKQMYDEIWHLQKDHFWVESMSNVDWERVYKLYHPLLDRIGCRSEFSDLAWEMQGELSTSHAYEIGGDQKVSPSYSVGMLGADFEFTGSTYKIRQIFNGEVTQFGKASPLRAPGINAKIGDELISIDGVLLDEKMTPERALFHKAGLEVEIRLKHQSSKDEEKYVVSTLQSDQDLRYRDWVETNKQYVHKHSQGRLGYVHIPDMGPIGFSEFFRNYLREHRKEGLVIDARYNGGGHVSQVILEMLSKKTIGFHLSRWTGVNSYPRLAPSGPMTVLTNRYAGSDGDIFPHAFKLLNLGPVIGTRTWGGVIGIYPRHFLADGGITTQPEFSNWFKDVGWGVENYGTDPDITVEITPQDYLAGKDPQLDRGIKECLSIAASQPPLKPQWKTFPDLSPGKKSSNLEH